MNESLRIYVAKLGAEAERLMRVEICALEFQDFEVAAEIAEEAEAVAYAAEQVCRAAYGVAA